MPTRASVQAAEMDVDEEEGKENVKMKTTTTRSSRSSKRAKSETPSPEEEEEKEEEEEEEPAMMGAVESNKDVVVDEEEDAGKKGNNKSSKPPKNPKSLDALKARLEATKSKVSSKNKGDNTNKETGSDYTTNAVPNPAEATAGVPAASSGAAAYAMGNDTTMNFGNANGMDTMNIDNATTTTTTTTHTGGMLDGENNNLSLIHI